jgi:hypothetical protein
VPRPSILRQPRARVVLYERRARHSEHRSRNSRRESESVFMSINGIASRFRPADACIRRLLGRMAPFPPRPTESRSYAMQKVPYTVEQHITLKRVSGVAPSPDGRWLAVAVQRLDRDGAKYV